MLKAFSKLIGTDAPYDPCSRPVNSCSYHYDCNKQLAAHGKFQTCYDTNGQITSKVWTGNCC